MLFEQRDVKATKAWEKTQEWGHPRQSTWEGEGRVGCYFFLTFNAFLALSISRGSGWFAPKTLSTYPNSPENYTNVKILKSLQLQMMEVSLTSLMRVSVWRIFISSGAFFPIPFCDGRKSFLAWPFVAPLPLPAPGIPSRPTGLFIPWPDPP